MSARRTILLAAALALAAAGCSSSSSSSGATGSTPAAGSSSSAGAATVDTSSCGSKPGVKATGTPIPLGAIATNQPGTSFTDIPNMAKAYFDCVNANGGINGHPIKLYIATEQTNPAQIAADAKQLVQTDKVVGIVGNTSIIECSVNSSYWQKLGFYIIDSGIAPECYSTPNSAAVNMGPRYSSDGERGGRAVVRDVSVEIAAGQVTALLGPNGAGKSTLVLAVGGVLRPRSGTVLLDGADITARRPERIRQAGVAIVPEGRRLLPDLTVEDNLRVASYALTREQAQAGRDRVLELFPQLGERLTAAARTLSGGEQQMVVLAQALVTQPRYLLIDELSLGLAPVVVSRLIPVIAAVAESGAGVLLIEQFATVALGLAQQAHIMEGGRIRFSGLARKLREQPELLSSAYLLRGSPAGDATGPLPGSAPS